MQMADRRWMYLENRLCEEYLSGIKAFIAATEADKLDQRMSAICCPCIDCQNERKFPSSLPVQAHLTIRRFMSDYLCWNQHGEDGVNDRDLQCGDLMGEEISAGQQTASLDGDERLPDNPTYQNDEADCDNQTAGHDMSEDELLDIGDNYASIADKMEEMVCDAMSYDGYSIEEFGKLEKMVRDMKTPLYPGCKEKWSKLFTSLKLLQLKATHHWTDRGFKALLDLLSDMLPEGNEIPKTTYEAKQTICPLGIDVEKIHACKNDCVLFRGDHADLTECPECGAPHYK